MNKYVFFYAIEPRSMYLLLLSILSLSLISFTLADKKVFNGTLQFVDRSVIDLVYPTSGFVNNVTYNVTNQNNYNGMLVIKMPRHLNIVGANEITGIFSHDNLTCDYVCARGWLTTTMSYVEFDSFGPSNVTYWIEVDYDVDSITEVSMIPLYVIGGLVLLMGLVVLATCVYIRRKEKSYQPV